MSNTVELIGYYGSDEIHACSAWTSTSREINAEKRSRIPAMLKQLADHGHHTPFEKSTLHFLMTVEQASHIHFLKHRIGVSINGESARYKELNDDRFYLPDDWDSESQLALQRHCELSFYQYHAIMKRLVDSGMTRKRAKESARFFLPYASQIQLDVSFNWRSFHHFLGLRKSPNAQVEIHDLASGMLDIVKNIKGNPFQHTIAAFGYSDNAGKS